MTRIVKVKTGNRLEEISSYSRIVAVDNWIFVSNTAGRNPATALSSVASKSMPSLTLCEHASVR